MADPFFCFLCQSSLDYELPKLFFYSHIPFIISGRWYILSSIFFLECLLFLRLKNIYKLTYEFKSLTANAEMSTDELLLKFIPTQNRQRMVKNMHKMLHFAAFPKNSMNTNKVVCKIYLNIIIINKIVTKAAMTTAEIDPAITPICDGSSVSPVNFKKLYHCSNTILYRFKRY